MATSLQFHMQRLVYTACGFEHDEAFGIEAVEPGRDDADIVLDLEVTRSLTVENVECRFGDIDANGKLVQGHGACPCQYGVGGDRPWQLFRFMWSRRGPSPETVS